MMFIVPPPVRDRHMCILYPLSTLGCRTSCSFFFVACERCGSNRLSKLHCNGVTALRLPLVPASSAHHKSRHFMAPPALPLNDGVTPQQPLLDGVRY